MAHQDDACPIARGVAFLGDQWTLLIVREALRGPLRYEDLRTRLGMSDNTLSRRLRRLVDEGLLERDGAGRRAPYQLTPAGSDLARVLAVVVDWNQRWFPIEMPLNPPAAVVEASVAMGLDHARARPAR
jgi:DNA-binding HxlR family transcriptional regulator